MKVILLLSIVLNSALMSYSQMTIVSDSLLNEACKTIINSKEKNDSVKIDAAFVQHFGKLLSDLPEARAENTYDYIFIRLQKLCPEFKAILDKLNPPSAGDFRNLEIKPTTKLNKKGCRDFLNYKNYYYFEDNGDTIHLRISNGFWMETFKDKTYSKLKLSWISDCEFELVFIESNNAIRNSLSKPGDKYKYQLTEKHDSYYDVCLDIREIKVLGTFRIYYIHKPK